VDPAYIYVALKDITHKTTFYILDELEWKITF